ncbi:MAG: 3-deoxy-manno-octulosonate cytidylyltransferase [Candidatus Aminicenantes bacterium]|nr:3-deoxy-manno-octulosonate cytidylyltransferase [Candidatus Aminicenantes bacterium]
MIQRKALAVIPVRYGSTRFPGKPLAPIAGRPMIQRVVDGVRSCLLLDRVIVATDDERILGAVRSFGAEAVMTSASHASGTDRVAEVAEAHPYPVIINVQGDEPLVTGGMLDGLVRALQDPEVPMASLMARVTDMSTFNEPHRVKVVVDGARNALYFSRASIPHGAAGSFFQHIGIYGYQREFLLHVRDLQPSRLEQCEKLEQLRVLESGFKIRMIEVNRPTLSVDVPGDIIRVENFLRAQGTHD